MLRKLMMAGALIVVGVAAAFGYGSAPQNGYELIEGKWLLGIVGGYNRTYQYGITAAGTNQVTSFQLPSMIQLLEVDTVSASTGVALPPCVQGAIVQLYNNTATTLTVYPAIANNGATSAQDTINNTTSLSLSGHTPEDFFCAKSGNWAAK